MRAATLPRAARRALTGCALLALTGSAVWTLAGSALAETFTGQVIGVTDGDTISVLRAGRREVVRLRGIDAPERRQAYGERAKQHAAALAFGKVVAVEAAGRDRHGRLLAEVRLPDGRSLNQELVRAGLAWWFRRYSTDATLGRLEAEARGARRGLWSDPAPVPPWEHRRGRRLDAVSERGREPGRARSHNAMSMALVALHASWPTTSLHQRVDGGTYRLDRPEDVSGMTDRAPPPPCSAGGCVASPPRPRCRGRRRREDRARSWRSGSRSMGNRR